MDILDVSFASGAFSYEYEESHCFDGNFTTLCSGTSGIDTMTVNLTESHRISKIGIFDDWKLDEIHHLEISKVLVADKQCISTWDQNIYTEISKCDSTSTDSLTFIGVSTKRIYMSEIEVYTGILFFFSLKSRKNHFFFICLQRQYNVYHTVIILSKKGFVCFHNFELFKICDKDLCAKILKMFS